MTLSPLTVAGVADTTRDIDGAASGVVNTVHQIGGSVGLSLIMAFAGAIKTPADFYQHAMLVDAGLILLALIIVIIVIFPSTKQSAV